MFGSLFFANPWGLLALLGIPAVLLIHLLRRKSRQVVVSTLFLVEHALPSSEGGRRIRRLRNSLPLWLQLLAVILLAWLLAQPRWIDQASTQTVVAVFDDSASLSAFRDRVLEAAGRELQPFQATAAATQWIFLRSDASRLASGSALGPVLQTARERWKPALGTHDPEEAFRLARTLGGEKGAILYFTDQPPRSGEARPSVQWISAGESLENAGFLTSSVAGDRWSALLKNYGTALREIRWRIEGKDAPWQTARLEPGAMTEISGTFPEGQDRLALELEGDRFGFDDRLPIIRPQEKPLVIDRQPDDGYEALFAQVARVAGPDPKSGTADLVLAVYDPLSPALPKTSAIVFVKDSGQTSHPQTGLLVAENHPLMESLNWQGLIARETLGVPFRDGDIPLLWQGSRPMIFLRPEGDSLRLIFNFDVRRSNAARLPAFALLIHRFLAGQRKAKPAYEAANVETRQQLFLAGHGAVQAPNDPQFFSEKDAGGKALFDGAAQFADVRESDFREAAPWRGESAAVQASRQAHAAGAALDPLWALLLAGLMVGNWFATGAPPGRGKTPGAG